MLKNRIKRLADHGARALKRLAQIDASIAALTDDDLLDLADIFEGQVQSPLAKSALAEMAKRKISL